MFSKQNFSAPPTKSELTIGTVFILSGTTTNEHLLSRSTLTATYSWLNLSHIEPDNRHNLGDKDQHIHQMTNQRLTLVLNKIRKKPDRKWNRQQERIWRHRNLTDRDSQESHKIGMWRVRWLDLPMGLYCQTYPIAARETSSSIKLNIHISYGSVFLASSYGYQSKTILRSPTH